MHLLAQQSAAAALNHIKSGVDLVRAVNGDVQHRLFVQGGQRNAQACKDRALSKLLGFCEDLCVCSAVWL